MRDVAIAAAVLAGAFFLAPAGSPVSATSFVTHDATNIHTIIKQPTHDAALSKATKAMATQTAKSPKQPATATLAAAHPTPTPVPDMATVQEGDTLTSLATDHRTTAQRLYDANTIVDQPDMIYPGQQLRVPAAGEQLADRPMPQPAPAAPAAVVQVQATVESAPAPAPAPVVSATPAVASGSVWDSIAQCESSGNWAINTGNGFYGGLQFTLDSWAAVGGSGMPNQASREEQIMRAQILQSRQGWIAWPACTAKLGLR